MQWFKANADATKSNAMQRIRADFWEFVRVSMFSLAYTLDISDIGPLKSKPAVSTDEAF